MTKVLLSPLSTSARRLELHWQDPPKQPATGTEEILEKHAHAVRSGLSYNTQCPAGRPPPPPGLGRYASGPQARVV